jgi:hypothetical protein
MVKEQFHQKELQKESSNLRFYVFIAMIYDFVA